MLNLKIDTWVSMFSFCCKSIFYFVLYTNDIVVYLLRSSFEIVLTYKNNKN